MFEVYYELPQTTLHSIIYKVGLLRMFLRPLNVLNLIPFVRNTQYKMQLYTQVLFIRVHKKRKRERNTICIGCNILKLFLFFRSDSCLLNITLTL